MSVYFVTHTHAHAHAHTHHTHTRTDKHTHTHTHTQTHILHSARARYAKVLPTLFYCLFCCKTIEINYYVNKILLLISTIEGHRCDYNLLDVFLKKILSHSKMLHPIRSSRSN